MSTMSTIEPYPQQTNHSAVIFQMREEQQLLAARLNQLIENASICTTTKLPRVLTTSLFALSS
jgi:hypothetical protein